MTARPTANKKPQVRGEPVVRKVLRAALEELAATGYAALRIDEVANRAGVNKTTIYRRWPTKEALVRSMLLSLTESRLADLPDTGSLRSDLLELNRLRRQEVESKVGQGVFRMLAAECANPEMKSIAEAVQRLRELPPKVILERARARGELAEGVDPDVVFHVLRSVAISELVTRGRAMDERRYVAILDVLLHGVLRPGAVESANGKARRQR